MAVRPLVVPDAFSGEGSWDQWHYHFKNVVAINDWNEEAQLKWLKVRLTGRAQTAYQRLPEAVQANLEQTLAALKERFEPASQKTRFQAELQARRKRKNESWADLADELRLFADKAYPELENNARERLALNAYLGLLENPQVAFGVKQKTPENLDAAVAATLELETYLIPKMMSVSSVEAKTHESKLLELLEKLVERVEKLEKAQQARQNPSRAVGKECFRCGEIGHLARNCTQEANKGEDQTLPISTVCAGGSYVYGKVNGVETNFTLDTGSAVTLLRADVWGRINESGALRLDAATNKKLVGVTGNLLDVIGQIDVEIELAGKCFVQMITVVSGLMTEAIVGLDFLSRQGVTIDFGERVLRVEGQCVSLQSAANNFVMATKKDKTPVESETVKLKKPSSKIEHYEIGDHVSIESNPKGQKSSSRPTMSGPYRVVKRISETVYRVQHFNFARERRVVKFERLKPCTREVNPLKYIRDEFQLRGGLCNKVN